MWSSPRPYTVMLIVGSNKINFQADVSLQFAFEALADLAARDEGAFASGKRRIVDQELQRNGRLVHFYGRKRRRRLIISDSFANIDVGDAGDGDDVA